MNILDFLTDCLKISIEGLKDIVYENYEKRKLRKSEEICEKFLSVYFEVEEHFQLSRAILFLMKRGLLDEKYFEYAEEKLDRISEEIYMPSLLRLYSWSPSLGSELDDRVFHAQLVVEISAIRRRYKEAIANELRKMGESKDTAENIRSSLEKLSEVEKVIGTLNAIKAQYPHFDPAEVQKKLREPLGSPDLMNIQRFSRYKIPSKEEREILEICEGFAEAGLKNWEKTWEIIFGKPYEELLLEVTALRENNKRYGAEEALMEILLKNIRKEEDLKISVSAKIFSMQILLDAAARARS